MKDSNIVLDKELYYPEILSLRNAEQRKRWNTIRGMQQVEVIDTMLRQVMDLIQNKNPGTSYTPQDLETEAQGYLNDHGGELYGNWIYYSWRKLLVRLLEEDDYVFCRTARNRNKITEEEQKELMSKTVGIIGLSVGKSAAVTMVMERNVGELRIADYDTLDLTNLNRIRSGVHHIGVNKTTIVAREIAEIDPYMKVKCFSEGLTESNMEEFFLSDRKIDVLIDECDSFRIKVLSRFKARELGIPVVMDTSDRGMIDIERFDKEPERPIFHGQVDEDILREVDNLTKPEQIKLGLQLFDQSKLSSRMLSSLKEVGKTIVSWPQLASSVVMGGASAAHITRKILLDEISKSGRFYLDIDEILD